MKINAIYFECEIQLKVELRVISFEKHIFKKSYGVILRQFIND